MKADLIPEPPVVKTGYRRSCKWPNIVPPVLAAILLVAMTACSSRPGSSAVAPTGQPSPTPVAQLAITPTAVITPTVDGFNLTWWTPEFLSPSASQPSGPLLEEYLAGFQAAHDGKVRVTPVVKAKYGKGGLLDYLRTSQPVAPSLLPDIVTLDVAELEQAASLGLLRPLDGLLDQETVASLYPFARSAGQFDGQSLGIQYVADLEQVAYDRTRVNRPPLTWAGLISDKIPYLFPAGSPTPLSTTNATEVVRLNFVSQYLSAGGKLDPATRQLVLEPEPLLRVLSFYDEAQQAGLLPVNIGEISSLDDTWTIYAQGTVPMADVSARRFLAEQQSLPNAGITTLPGWSGPAVPVANGWALAIVTPDPERQKVAAEFIAWLLATERAGRWAQAAGWLPTSPAALATWGTAPVNEFLGQQLASAVSKPIGPEYTQTAARIQKAVQAVLKGENTPADATQAVLAPQK
jgi:ABC-type glycerol-3-phosphate transport system substrate-binding protein